MITCFSFYTGDTMINYFILTGIPRSGTTLLCSLLNHIQNVVCLNEISDFYDTNRLPTAFSSLNYIVRNIKKYPSRRKDGAEITDTQTKGHRVELTPIVIDSDKPVYIGSKINYPYLDNIDQIIKYGYPIIAMVRNPVFTIASWNMHEKNINEAHVMPEDFERWPRYSKIEFKSDDKYGRQAELWNYMARIILDKIGRRFTYRYEALVKDTNAYLNYITHTIGLLHKELNKPLPELKNLNDIRRFDNIDFVEIAEAVLEYAPLMKEFGY